MTPVAQRRSSAPGPAILTVALAYGRFEIDHPGPASGENCLLAQTSTFSSAAGEDSATHRLRR